MAERRQTSRRTQIARIRATRVKAAVAIGALVAFLVAMLFARVSYAGHAKHRANASPLNPPPKFLDIVRQSRLESGIVAAPQAPPQVATATS